MRHRYCGWEWTASGIGLLLVLALFAPAAARAAVWLQVDAQSHSGPVVRMAADAVRDVVVTASEDKTARIWSLSDGRATAVLRPPVGAAQIGRLFGATLHPTQDLVAVAGTSAELAADGHSIWLFEVSAGRFVRRIDALGGHVKRLVWSTSGTVLFAGYGDRPAVRAFDLQGRPLLDQPMNRDVFGLAARQDRVAAVARDGSVMVWRVDGSTVAPVASFSTGANDPISIDFSPDARRVVVGYFVPGTGAEVFAVDGGARVFALASPPGPMPEDASMRRGHPIDRTQAVAWAASGGVIFTGGSLDAAGRTDGRIRRNDGASGRLLGEHPVAPDSVTDLVALPAAREAPTSERVAWSSVAGSWGTLVGTTSRALAEPRVDFLVRRGAAELYLSPDGRRVRWVRGAQREPVSFDLVARAPGDGATGGLRAPATRRGLFDAAENFENNTLPSVRGQRIPLDPGEISRALTYVGPDGDVVIATSVGLRRIDRSMRVVWDVRTATEVRAVNAVENGTVVVTAMSDGTVRWWRASDGALLLSLLAARDAWVAWAPTGHYAASPGGESLIGWLIDRPGAPLPDHFTVARFREVFHRPDVVDRVLDTLDPQAALRAADGSLRDPELPGLEYLRPQAAPPAAPQPPATGAAAPVDQLRPTAPLVLPPVLASLEPARIRVPVQGTRAFQFTVRSDDASGPVAIEVRIDGRLVDPVQVTLPPRFEGSVPAQVAIALPPRAGTVQVIARSGERASEPLTFTIDGDGGRRLEPDRANGTLYVVAVGVSEYARAEYRLGLPSKDARDFADAMRRQQGRLYRQVEVRLLTDAQATRANLLQALEWLRSQVGPEDVGMLFLAGHGLNDGRQGWHFLPHDGDRDRLRSTGVPDAALNRAMSRVRGRAVVFLDTCFAGEVTEAFTRLSRDTARVANALSAPENGVIVFASSTSRQESLERAEWGNGAFTKVLIEGLNGAAQEAGEGIVTLRGLGPFLAREVAKLTSGRQTPVSLLPPALPDRILASLRVTLQSWWRGLRDRLAGGSPGWEGPGGHAVAGSRVA